MKNVFRKFIGIPFLVMALILSFAPGVVGADPPPQYTFTTTNFPGSGNTWIWGMNDRADVVGFYRETTSQKSPAHGFFRVDGSFNSFDHDGVSSNTTVTNISNSGKMIGDYNPQPFTGGYHWHGFEITKEGDVNSIDDPTQATTVPFHIMPDGTIIGHVQKDLADLTTRHGYIMSPDGSFEYSDIPYSQHNDATPNLKTIVGNYVTSDGIVHGYVLDNGEKTTLDFPGSILTVTYDVNPAGNRVAGFYRNSTGFHGYVAEKQGAKGAWQFRAFDVPGAAMTWVTCGNAGGQLAGAYFAGGRQYGFIATPLED